MTPEMHDRVDFICWYMAWKDVGPAQAQDYLRRAKEEERDRRAALLRAAAQVKDLEIKDARIAEEQEAYWAEHRRGCPICQKKASLRLVVFGAYEIDTGGASAPLLPKEPEEEERYMAEWAEQKRARQALDRHLLTML